ncbi:MAG TPA: hypothetical protein VIM07_00290 [Chitinophagaceae bacterium]
MAKPIKHTPVLKGKDATNFYTKIEENRYKKVDADYLLSIRHEAQKLKSILKIA